MQIRGESSSEKQIAFSKNIISVAIAYARKMRRWSYFSMLYLFPVQRFFSNTRASVSLNVFLILYYCNCRTVETRVKLYKFHLVALASFSTIIVPVVHNSTLTTWFCAALTQKLHTESGASVCVRVQECS